MRLTAVAFLLLTLTLTACLGLLSEDDAATEAVNIPSPYVGSVELRCTQSCADRGQCGQAADQNDRVLLSSVAPLTNGHDMLALPGSRATILSNATQTLVNESTQQQLTHPFYFVALEDGTGQQGWVAEWCVIPVN